MGSVPIFDIGDGIGQLPQDFAKFFYSRCHVDVGSAGEDRIGSQMTEVRDQGDRKTVIGQ